MRLRGSILRAMVVGRSCGVGVRQEPPIDADIRGRAPLSCLFRGQGISDGAAVGEFGARRSFLGLGNGVGLGSNCWVGLFGFRFCGSDRDRIGFDLQNGGGLDFFARCLHFVEVGLGAAHAGLGEVRARSMAVWVGR